MSMNLYGLAITEAKLGHLDNALNLFNQANARSPHDPDILGDMGITYFMAMRPAEAIDPLREAVEGGVRIPRPISISPRLTMLWEKRRRLSIR